MKIITAPEKYERQPNDVCVFLAGGITNCREWQDELIKYFEDNFTNTDNLILFNPRRKNFPIHDKSASYIQIQWEFDALEQCDIFSMYFDSGVSDQPICMYELGRNICRMQMRFPNDWEKRIVVTSESEYKRKQDVVIQTGLATANKVSVEFDFAYHCEFIYKAYKQLIH